MLSGRYRLESKLGSGGMSTVYLARDETLERWVAAKVLHREISDQPDQIERFRREARAVAQVSHPNVVAVIDAGEDGGRPYIVFEYVEGETLKERIDRSGRLPYDEAAAYAIEVGRGLGAAHARRLVHRDVKPQNVLIDSEGRAKVTDFGIARELEQDGLTATGRVLGTTDYVSPEQAMGKEVDARSDIYSLGVLLYEMLTGDVPFKADNLVGVAMKHVNEQMPNVQKVRPGVSSALAAVVERATQKDVDKRYPDMAAMLADLEAALEVEVSRAGRSTGEATTVLDSVSSTRRKLPDLAQRLGRRDPPRARGVAVALLIAGISSEDKGRGGGSARWRRVGRRRGDRDRRGRGLRPAARRRERAPRRDRVRGRQRQQGDRVGRRALRHGRLRRPQGRRRDLRRDRGAGAADGDVGRDARGGVGGRRLLGDLGAARHARRLGGADRDARQRRDREQHPARDAASRASTSCSGSRSSRRPRTMTGSGPR